MLAKMSAERELRYGAFRETVGPEFRERLPNQLQNAVFVDFSDDGTPRRLRPRRHVLSDNLSPEQGNVQPDYRRTLWPFIDKLRGTPTAPPLLERLLTSPRWAGRTSWFLLIAYLTFLLLTPSETLGGTMGDVKFWSLPFAILAFVHLRMAVWSFRKQFHYEQPFGDASD
jgi:hypothetical protein